jgi:hypothetical protein
MKLSAAALPVAAARLGQALQLISLAHDLLEEFVSRSCLRRLEVFGEVIFLKICREWHAKDLPPIATVHEGGWLLIDFDRCAIVVVLVVSSHRA